MATVPATKIRKSLLCWSQNVHSM